MALSEKQATQIYNDLFLLGSFEDVDLKDILSLLRYCDDVYHNDSETLLSDQEYDALKQYAEGMNPSDPYFVEVGSEVRGGKVKLPHQMGSLTQAQIGGDIGKWIQRYSLHNANMVISDKLDGTSILLVYNDGKLYAAFSRGDGVEGADITRHARKIKSLPQSLPYAKNITVRAEVIIQKSKTDDFKATALASTGRSYKNLRNAVAGMMNRETNPDVLYGFLDVVAYQIVQMDEELPSKWKQFSTLQANGFIIAPNFGYAGSTLSDDSLRTFVEGRLKDSLYELDGVVIDVDDAVLRSKINPSKDTLNPEYARKYKIGTADNYAETTVIEVEWNASKHKFAKPRVRIQPVELEGVTIQHATGFNAKFIRDNGIGPGAVIGIIRSGGVIPFIQTVIKRATAQMPDQPFVWNDTEVDIILTGSESQSIVEVQQNVDFFKSMGIDFLAEGNVTRLHDAGFTTIESILLATENQIQRALNSDSIGTKVFDAIHRRLQSGIYEYELAGSTVFFGRGVGVRKMKKLWEATKGDLDSVIRNTAAISDIEGFDNKTARKIFDGVAAYDEFLDKVNHLITFKQFEAPKVGNWTGKAVVFTGIRSKEAEKRITDAGGTVSGSVSKKTTYVVAEDVNSTSGKAAKAQELGIPVITLDELMDMF